MNERIFFIYFFSLSFALEKDVCAPYKIHGEIRYEKLQNYSAYTAVRKKL